MLYRRQRETFDEALRLGSFVVRLERSGQRHRQKSQRQNGIALLRRWHQRLDIAVPIVPFVHNCDEIGKDIKAEIICVRE